MLLSATQIRAQQPDTARAVRVVNAKLDSGSIFTKQDRPELALRMGLECLEYMDDLEHAPHIQKRILTHVAHTLNRLHRSDLAIPHLVRILEIEERTNSKFSKLYAYTLGSLGSFYYLNGEAKKAYDSYIEAVKLSKELEKQVYHSSAINNLGIYYERTGQLDSAMFQYKRALPLIPWGAPRDSAMYLSIRDNQASVYEKWGNEREAIILLEENLSMSLPLHDQVNRRITTALKLCELYMQLDITERIPELLQIATENLELHDTKLEYAHREEIERTWVRYAKSINDSKLELSHMTLLNEVTMEQLRRADQRGKSIDQVMADYTMQNANYELKRRSKMLALAQSEAQTNMYLLIILACFSAFILFTTLYFYSRRVAFQRIQTQLKQQELENKELLNQRLRTDLSHKERDFSNLMMQVSLKTDWAKDITDKVNELIKGRKTVESTELKKLLLDLKQQSGIHEKLDMYQSGMDEVNTKFYALLEEKFPTLTRSEKEVCGLIRLNLDGKEIASLRNINPSSVRKMRQRIRKKFGISEDVDIYRFIQSL